MKNPIKFIAILLLSFTFNSCDEAEELADVKFSTNITEEIPVHISQNQEYISKTVTLHSNEDVKLVFDEASLRYKTCDSYSCGVVKETSETSKFGINSMSEGEWYNAVFTYKVYAVNNNNNNNNNNDDNDNDNDNYVNLDVDTRNATSVKTYSATFNGVVDSGDNAEVWFVYSSSDTTPDCDGNDSIARKSGRYDSNESFSTRVYGLSTGTTYHYRACAKTRDGQKDYSDRPKSFTTRGGYNNNNDNNDNNDYNYNDEDQYGDVYINTRKEGTITKQSAVLRGVVSGGKDVKVWFVYSHVNNNPGCEDYGRLGIEKEVVLGYHKRNDSFEDKIRGLKEKTQYHYKACGEADGILSEGTVYSFNTDGKDEDVTFDVATRKATNIKGNQVQINGETDLGHDIDDAIVYFKYGINSINENKTNDAEINENGPFRAVLKNLKSGTTYKYQAFTKDAKGRIKAGDQMTFTTTGAKKYVAKPVVKKTTYVAPKKTYYAPKKVVSKKVETTKEDTVKVIIADTKAKTEGFETNKEVSQSRNSGYGTSIDASTGDVVYYKVTVENNTDEAMKNVTVTDQIPYELELDNDESTDDNAPKYLTWKVRKLEAGATRTFITEMRVSDKVAKGDEILSKAEVVSDNGSEDTNAVSINIDEGGRSSQAASIFGSNSSFLPDTLLGYLALVAVVLLIAFLVVGLIGGGSNSRSILAKLKREE